MEKILNILFFILLIGDILMTNGAATKRVEEKQELQENSEFKQVQYEKPEIMGTFQQLEQALLQRYGNKIDIIGFNYPIGREREILISILTCIQYGFIGLLLVGDSYLKNKIPQYWNTISENKMKYGLLVFIFGNMIIGQLQSTGAFEVYLNGELIHSKLLSGQTPSLEQIIRRIPI